MADELYDLKEKVNEMLKNSSQFKIRDSWFRNWSLDPVNNTIEFLLTLNHRHLFFKFELIYID